MKTLKLKNDYRFIIYGDSITKGVFFDEETGRHALLEDNYANLLKDTLNGVIINAGKFGNTLLKGLQRLRIDVLKKEPDIVLLEFGGNDCDFNWEQIANDPLGVHNPKTDFAVFSKTLKDLIKTLNNIEITPILMTLPPLDAEKYFQWVSKNCKETGDKILTWLGGVSRIYWWHERYNSAIVDVAEETRTRIIDVRRAFLKYPDYTQFICRDGIHPNKAGHKVIADVILEYVKSNYIFLLREV